MLQYSIDAAKTHEIMARFRPIAPKPAPSPDSPPENNLRPAALSPRSRARKRGRGAAASSVFMCKRPRSFFPAAPPRGFAPFISRQVPVERDLLQKLQEQPRIIAPHPIRPVGSRITVGCCITDTISVSAAVVPKKAKEVEEEVESESLPAVVSDSNNRVRLANSAYKELVGQPECPWLELMVSPGLKRISGEVTLDLADSSMIPVAADGFSCRVKIRWACNSIDVPCDVIRLCCESKNYFFVWRFKTSSNCEA